MQKTWIKSTSKLRDKTVYFKAIVSVKFDSDTTGFSLPILCLFGIGAGHYLCYPEKNIDKKSILSLYC